MHQLFKQYYFTNINFELTLIAQQNKETMHSTERVIISIEGNYIPEGSPTLSKGVDFPTERVLVARTTLYVLNKTKYSKKSSPFFDLSTSPHMSLTTKYTILMLPQIPQKVIVNNSNNDLSTTLIILKSESKPQKNISLYFSADLKLCRTTHTLNCLNFTHCSHHTNIFYYHICFWDHLTQYLIMTYIILRSPTKTIIIYLSIRRLCLVWTSIKLTLAECHKYMKPII